MTIRESIMPPTIAATMACAHDRPSFGDKPVRCASMMDTICSTAFEATRRVRFSARRSSDPRDAKGEVFPDRVAQRSVGPKYRPPSVQLQPFHNAPAIAGRATDSLTPPLDTWWTGFQDSELTRIIQRALDQNLDLQAAVTRVEQSRAVAKEAGAKRLPGGTLNAQSEAFRQSLESQVGRYSPVLPGFNRNQAYYDLNVGATWEADIFGGLKRGAQAATAEAQAAEAAHMGTRVSIVADAADAYFQIRGRTIRWADHSGCQAGAQWDVSIA